MGADGAPNAGVGSDVEAALTDDAKSKTEEPSSRHARQLAFAFPNLAPGLAREDLVVTEANAEAVGLLAAWRARGEGAFALSGPAGSGKSHLAVLTAAEIGAQTFLPNQIDEAVATYGQRRPCVLEDVHAVSNKELLMNLLTSSMRPSAPLLLLTGQGAVEDWAGGLRDVETRLSALPRAAIRAPDEGLLKGLILKLCRDRQIQTAETAADYAAKRLRRSFAEARRFVDAAEQIALVSGRAINRDVAQKALAELSRVEAND